MKVLGFKTAVLCGASLFLSGCGGRMYHPAASSLGKSLEVMQPVLASDLSDYPNEVRAALLEDAPKEALQAWVGTPSELLCRPVYSSVKAAGYANKLDAAGKSLISVSGESPTEFPDLAAATLGKYAVSAGDIDPAELAQKAHSSCLADFNFVQARDNFVAQGGAEANIAAAFAGLTELWGLVEPVAKGILGFVDQQRRARAIITFLRSDGAKLKGYVDSLADFSERKAAYERAAAARKFSQALMPASSGSLSEEQKTAILDAAAAYDTLRALDPTTSYAAVGKSIDRLVNAADGKFDQEDLSAAISGFGESFSSLKQVSESIAALEKDGEKHAALKAAIDKIRGKKAPAASSEKGEE